MKLLLYYFLFTAQFMFQITWAADAPCTGVTTAQTEFFTACTDECKIALCDTESTKLTENACPNSASNCVKNADNTGFCSTTPGPTACPPKPFTCTSPGRFPDPSDCRAYYLCSSTLVVLRRTCLPTEVFYEPTLACAATANPALCITVDCKNRMGNGIYSPYGASTKYYALCTTNTADPPVTTIKMYQCATGAVFDKSPSVSKCVYTCTAPGKFAYSLDTKKYYNCVRGTDGRITATILSCPPDSIFVAADRDCGFPPGSLNRPAFLKK